MSHELYIKEDISHDKLIQTFIQNQRKPPELSFRLQRRLPEMRAGLSVGPRNPGSLLYPSHSLGERSVYDGQSIRASWRRGYIYPVPRGRTAVPGGQQRAMGVLLGGFYGGGCRIHHTQYRIQPGDAIHSEGKDTGENDPGRAGSDLPGERKYL